MGDLVGSLDRLPNAICRIEDSRLRKNTPENNKASAGGWAHSGDLDQAPDGIRKASKKVICRNDLF